MLHKNRSSNLSQSIAIKIQTLLLFVLFGGGGTNRTQANTGSLAKAFDVLFSVLLLSEVHLSLSGSSDFDDSGIKLSRQTPSLKLQETVPLCKQNKTKQKKKLPVVQSLHSSSSKFILGSSMLSPGLY